MRSKAQPPDAAAGGGQRRRDWPLPLIGGGLGMMLGFIPVVILILIVACSYGKWSDETTSLGDEKSSEKGVHALRAEMEPRVAVIMAGETNPTHVARPVPAAARRSEQV